MEKNKNPFGLPINLQSIKRPTRSRKENDIDYDLIRIKDSLEAVSLSVFIDGTYENSVYKERIGEVISLSNIDVVEDPISAAAGTYVFDQDRGQITTNGSGVALILSLVVREKDGLFSIDFDSSSILSGGTGFSDSDSIFIKSKNLGGSDNDEVIELILGEGSTDSDIILSSSISVNAEEGIILDGALFINRDSLPTEDPLFYGQLWIDENNFLKVSNG